MKWRLMTFVIITMLLATDSIFAQHHSYQWIKGKKADKPIWGDVYEPPRAYTFKVNVLGGYILPLTKNLELITQRPVSGGEICLEFPSWQAYPWQKYWGDPILGVGIVGMDLGNPKVLGAAFAAYPYLSIRLVDIKHFKFNIKFGTGLSFFTKTYNDGDTDPSHFYGENTNTAIGSIVNCYLTGGLNLSFPIAQNFAITVDAGFSHMSNGSILQPNGGINMFYGSVGGSYTYDTGLRPRQRFGKTNRDKLPYTFSLNLTASFGGRELYYLDNKAYPIGSFHFGGTYNICNFYALGLGLDAFYDGVFVRQGVVPGMSKEERELQTKHTKFGRYLILNDKFENKIKAGISINNEFLIGRVTILLDWGIYLYNPLRNGYVKEHPKYGRNRPLFYSYNIDDEDGWNWFRLGLRCRVHDNMYMQVGVKTHLNKAEMIEWGIGYLIPFTKRADTQNLLYHKDRHFVVYHY